MGMNFDNETLFCSQHGEVGTVPLPINFFVQVGHLGKHLKTVSIL